MGADPSKVPLMKAKQWMRRQAVHPLKTKPSTKRGRPSKALTERRHRPAKGAAKQLSARYVGFVNELMQPARDQINLLDSSNREPIATQPQLAVRQQQQTSFRA